MSDADPARGASRSVAVISSSAGALINFRGPLMREMVERGHRVWALAPDMDDGVRDQLRDWRIEPVDFPVRRAGTNPLGDLRALARLVRTLRTLRPDVALAHFMKPVIYGMVAARLAGVPRRYAMIEGLGYAFTDDGVRSRKRAVIRTGMTAMLRMALRQARLILFLNPDDLRELADAGVVDRRKTVVLGGIGVELDRFSASSPPSAPVFLMVGRLLRDKGVWDYAEAARLLSAELPGARFLLVGGTDQNPGAVPLDVVRGWVTSGVIEWAGEVTDVRPWIERAGIYVLPSYREGVPRSTQEAMAMGRAVVTTDVPGCRETVEEGRNGFLVPVRDPAALAAAMGRLARDPSLVERFGRESRRMAEERFDSEKVNRRLLGHLEL